MSKLPTRGSIHAVEMLFELQCAECGETITTKRKDWLNIKCKKCGRSDMWNLVDFVTSTEMERLAKAQRGEG